MHHRECTPRIAVDSKGGNVIVAMRLLVRHGVVAVVADEVVAIAVSCIDVGFVVLRVNHVTPVEAALALRVAGVA